MSARGWALVLAAGASLSACVGDADPGDRGDSATTRVSDAECAHLFATETTRVWIEERLVPSAPQVAKDTLDPDSADRSEYGLVLGVEQRYENLLNRRLRISLERVELTAASGHTYTVVYDPVPPFDLEPHEARTIEFFVPLTADEADPADLAALLDPGGTVHFENDVHVEIPGTDNCGYAGGPRARTDGGTVGVERPDSRDPADDVLSAFFKALLHA